MDSGEGDRGLDCLSTWFPASHFFVFVGLNTPKITYEKDMKRIEKVGGHYERKKNMKNSTHFFGRATKS